MVPWPPVDCNVPWDPALLLPGAGCQVDTGGVAELVAQAATRPPQELVALEKVRARGRGSHSAWEALRSLLLRSVETP